MRINVSIDDELLLSFDEYCKKYRYARSELLSQLMRDVVYTLHTEPPKKSEILNGGENSKKINSEDEKQRKLKLAQEELSKFV